MVYLVNTKPRLLQSTKMQQEKGAREKKLG